MNRLKALKYVGRPKICVPVVAGDINEIESNIHGIVESKADIIEFRIDYLVNISLENTQKGIETIRKYSDLPMLVTFRSGFEGGDKDTSREEYEHILEKVITSGADFDGVDIEMFTPRAKELVKIAHDNNLMVVMSSHDFNDTPEMEELSKRFLSMKEKGCDIAKIACMPKDYKDVLRLMEATLDAKKNLEIPVVSMSMSGLGLVSRMSGQCYGSAITFASAGKASAPGQIDSKELEKIISVISKNLEA